MAKNVGTNVSYEVKDKKLTITVDLSKENGNSKSGKTIMVGSTKGNVKFAGPGDNEFIMGVNVYKYPDAQ